MEIALGTKGLKNTFQEDFPETTKCVHCKRTARIAVVITEEEGEEKYICDLYKTNGKKNLWLHDACAIAVYFCKKCLKSTALYNQG